MCYRKAIDLDPDLADAQYNLATVLVTLERPAEALGLLQAATRVQPDFPEALNALGVVHMRLGRPAEATSHFREAIGLRSDSAEAQYNLGMALLTVGDMPTGRLESEWRWMIESRADRQRAFVQPQWRGEVVGLPAFRANPWTNPR